MILYLLLAVLIATSCNLMASGNIELMCTPLTSICPGNGDMIQCECQVNSNSLSWMLPLVQDGSSVVLSFSTTSNKMMLSDPPYYSAVLCVNDGTTLTSKLNVTLFRDMINVRCALDNNDANTTTLNITRSPSPPMNLSYVTDSITNDNVSVILEWSPPRDNGGASITEYQIFINSSEVLQNTTHVTMATIVLNLEEEYFVQVRSVNCAGESDNASTIITVSDLSMAPATNSDGVTTPDTETVSMGSSDNPSPTPAPVPEMRTIIVIGTIGGFIIIIIIIAICIAIAVVRSKAVKSKKRITNNGTVIQDDSEYSHFTFKSTNNQATNDSSEYSHFRFDAGHNNHRIAESEYSRFGSDTSPRFNIQDPNVIESGYSMVEMKNISESIRLKDYTAGNNQKTKTEEETKKELPSSTLTYAEVGKTGAALSTGHGMDTFTIVALDDAMKVKYSVVESKIHPADKLLNLDSLLIQLRDVACKWEELGVVWDTPTDEIQEIKKSCERCDFDCLIEVCDAWIKKHSANETTPTWTSVSAALKKIDCQELSEEIMGIYETGELPKEKTIITSNDSDTNYDDVVLPKSDVIEKEDDLPPPLPPKLFDLDDKECFPE